MNPTILLFPFVSNDMDGELDTRYYAIVSSPKYDDLPRNKPLKDLKMPIRPVIVAFAALLLSEREEYVRINLHV